MTNKATKIQKQNTTFNAFWTANIFMIRPIHFSGKCFQEKRESKNKRHCRTSYPEWH